MAVALVCRFVIVTPGMGPITPPARLLPVSTTVRLAPWLAFGGEMPVITGPTLAPFTWNNAALLVPLAEVTVTLRSPGLAAPLIMKFAVI